MDISKNLILFHPYGVYYKEVAVFYNHFAPTGLSANPVGGVIIVGAIIIFYNHFAPTGLSPPP